MNIKNILTITILVLCSMPIIAQHKPNREKIKALKTAFITERVNLSNKEAQAFWPVYNAYEDKRDALHKKERKNIHSKLKDIAIISEEEASGLLLKHTNLQEEKHKLSSLFIKEISTVISAKKTIQLLKAEKDFRRELIKIHRERIMGERK